MLNIEKTIHKTIDGPFFNTEKYVIHNILLNNHTGQQ